MSERYDLIIIGGGPSGLSSGIYAGRAKRKTLILEKGLIGGRAALTESIVNYPGFSEISGRELMAKMFAQAENFGVEIKREKVIGLKVESDGTKIISTRRNEYYANAVIAATGTKPKILGIKGEEKFVGRGIAYCAACDAEFYKDSTVVVLGSGDQAIEESEFIARYAEKVIIIVIHGKGILDCNKTSAERVMQNPKISFVWDSTVSEITGNDSVDGVVIKNIVSGEESRFECDGVFFFAGITPETEYLNGELKVYKNSWIKTNDRMETGFNGVFAAGDVRQKELRQIATAVNDGAVAAVMADKYLEQQNAYRLMRERSFKEPLTLLFWSSENAGVRENTGEYSISAEIDIAKNHYLAEYFGITEKNLSEGIKIIRFYNGQVNEL